MPRPIRRRPPDPPATLATERHDSSGTASDRKAAILAAAARVIARRGARGLRIDEVGREAGVSNALVYYYFAGRDDLLRQTLHHANDLAIAYTRRHLPPGARGREALTALLAGEFQDDETVVVSATVWRELADTAIFEPALRDAVQSTRRRWCALVADAIRGAQADGTVPTAVDPEAAAQRLTATIEGLTARWLAGELATAEAQSLVLGGLERECGPVPANAPLAPAAVGSALG